MDILKEIIRKKAPNELIDPDDLLKEKMIKSFAVMSLIVIIISLAGKLLSNNDLNLGLIGSTVITLFFMMLFLHINNKSKNPSVIMFGLTFLSAMIPTWF